MPHEEPTLDYERYLLLESDSQVVVAIDEVGRGALAGPVTIGAVLIKSDTPDPPPGVRDSKALSAPRRARMVPELAAWAQYAVIHVSAQRIDQVGITGALGEGAVSAVSELLTFAPNSVATLLLDGKHDYISPVCNAWKVCTVIRGDAVCASISAASILAKEARDAVMRDLHNEDPRYGWDRNVGYGTTAHRAAISEWGASSHHRHTWKLT